jgi:hypothetical protein
MLGTHRILTTSTPQLQKNVFCCRHNFRSRRHCHPRHLSRPLASLRLPPQHAHVRSRHSHPQTAPVLIAPSHNSSSNPAGTLPALTARQVCQRVDRLHCCSRAHGHRHDLVQSRATGPAVPCSRQYWVQVGGVFNLLISLSLKPLLLPPLPPFHFHPS